LPTIELLRREENGAYVIDMDDVKLGTAVLEKANGTTMYLTRDFAAACDRYPRYKHDRFIYVAGLQQELHFKQLFHILGLAGEDTASKCAHAGFGLVKGMSTRRGQVVFLQDLLDEAAARMLSIMEEHSEKMALVADPKGVSEALGLSAIIVQDLFARRAKDYKFDWNAMLKSEGNTGPFLQYTHARLCSIERKVLDEIGPPTCPLDVELLTCDPSANALICQLALYEDTLALALEQLEPSVRETVA
jgi:arginyl-tRNA synthetase